MKTTAHFILGMLLITFISSRAGEKAKLNLTTKQHFFKYAQGGGSGRPFVIKSNLVSIAFKNYNLAAEYAFHKNLSGSVGFRFMMPYNLASLAGQSEPINMKGFAITPEFRFYPGKKEENQAPHGFYLGLYGRYSSFSLETNVPLDAPTVNGVAVPGIAGVNITIDGSLKQLGGGFIMGMQWAKKGFVFDWSLVGMGVANSRLSISTQNDILKYNTAADQFSNTLSFADATAALGNYKPNVKVDTSTGTATVSVNGMLPQIRSILFGNMSFGYRF